ncbi:MAG: Veg family protein [Clostridia bacterium]
MKFDTSALENVKQKIAELKGANVTLTIHRGRKKYDNFCGVVDCVYPSVFTITTYEKKQQQSQTFSYFDVLCGDVIIG